MSSQWNSPQHMLMGHLMKEFLRRCIVSGNLNEGPGGQSQFQNQGNSFCNEPNWQSDFQNQGNSFCNAPNWQSGFHNQGNNFCNQPIWQESYAQNQGMNPMQFNTSSENQNFSSNSNWSNANNSRRNNRHIRNTSNKTTTTNLQKPKNTPQLQIKAKKPPPPKITTVVNKQKQAEEPLKNNKQTEQPLTIKKVVEEQLKKPKETQEFGQVFIIPPTPYKNKEFLNAKRCIQRLGKLNYDTLDEKQRLRLDRAREIFARHKKAGNRKFIPVTNNSS